MTLVIGANPDGSAARLTTPWVPARYSWPPAGHTESGSHPPASAPWPRLGSALPPDGSSATAHRFAPLLLSPPPGSSASPADPDPPASAADRRVAAASRDPVPAFSATLVLPGSTAGSSSANPGSRQCAATGSSPGCASAPTCAGASATAAGHALPYSAPRCVETAFPAADPAGAGHPACPSTAACAGSANEWRPHLQSTTPASAAPADARTTACSRCFPPPPAPLRSATRRISALLRCRGTTGVRSPHLFLCPPWQFVESSDDNHSL